MKTLLKFALRAVLLGLAIVLLMLLGLLAIPAKADTIDYTLVVQNAPGGLGDFSWEIQHDGFIQPPPLPIFGASGNCTNCTSNLFTSFASVSEPSNGGGCAIAGVLLMPDFGPAPVTLFSPVCAGGGDAFSGGLVPDVGTLGTFSQQWLNPDGTMNMVSLAIRDMGPVATPEPRTWSLLICGLGLVWLGRKIKL